jgi:hypothetical protein
MKRNNMKVFYGKVWIGVIIIIFMIIFINIGRSVGIPDQFKYLNIDLLTYIPIILAIVSAILIWTELKQTKKIQEAEFVVSLNQSYVENETYAKVYTCLEQAYIDKMEPNLARIEISNYLTFFETMYLLINKKVINYKVLNDLFAYRFFLAVHSEYVQSEKLVKNPDNFRNIYKLEKEWIEYRKKEKLTIFRDELNLEKIVDRAVYLKIINK